MRQNKSKINVFIVDDDRNILALYSLYFKLYGLNVIGKANNGFDAIKQLKNHNIKPDVIIIDYHMPLIDGIETSKLILKINKSFKIIMISGDPSVREKALTNGVIDFFEKPKNIGKLCQHIKNLFNHSN
ncbi:MAG: response regulator transcription factor [Candidatus Odinarchaeota archaeon]